MIGLSLARFFLMMQEGPIVVSLAGKSSCGEVLEFPNFVTIVVHLFF